MKNLSLFIILVGLVLFTYYFEEVKQVKENVIELEKKRLFKEFDTFNKLQTKNYTVSRKDSWFVDNLSYPASDQLLSDFIHIISNINIVSEIKSDHSDDFFRENRISFKLFTNEDVFSYELGDVSTLTGKFYVRRMLDNKIFICQDDSRFSGTYKSDLDQSLQKYLRIRSILMGQEDLFIERKLFYSFDVGKIKKIKIDSKHNRWFELDLVENSTIPIKYPNVKYKKISNVIQYFFDNTVIKKLIGSGQNILSNPVSELKIDQEGSEKTIKLYAGLNGNYGHFIKFNDQDFIFELDDNTFKIFQTHVQDFWNKKFLINIDFKSIDKFSYELSFNNKKYYGFEVSNLETFEIKSLDKAVSSINKNLMNFMFNLIFNLVDFKEAKYIEQVVDFDDSQLYLKIFKKNFGISVLDGKIEVIDFKEKLKYHFDYNTQQFKEDTISRIFTVVTN